MTEPIHVASPGVEPAQTAVPPCACHADAAAENLEREGCRCHLDAGQRFPPWESAAVAPEQTADRWLAGLFKDRWDSGSGQVSPPPARAPGKGNATVVRLAAVVLLVPAALLTLFALIPAVFVALALFLPVLAPILFVAFGIVATHGLGPPAAPGLRHEAPAELAAVDARVP